MAKSPIFGMGMALGQRINQGSPTATVAPFEHRLHTIARTLINLRPNKFFSQALILFIVQILEVYRNTK